MGWIKYSRLSRDTVHALHIRKSGGTAIRNAVRPYHPRIFKRKIWTYQHQTTFADILRNHPAARILFCVRDPAKRFVSGFNSRLRKSQPRRFKEWDAGEQLVFDAFKTANELAEALNSPDPVKKMEADWSMKLMPHLSYSLTYWLNNPDYLEQHKENIFYIAETKTLDEDFEYIKSSIGLPAEASLPRSDADRHATPAGFSTQLSEEGLKNVRNHFRDDYEIYEWCLGYREAMGWPPDREAESEYPAAKAATQKSS